MVMEKVAINRKKSNLVLVVILVGILTTISYLLGEPGITDDTILLGISNAQTGPAQFLGQQYTLGAQSYFKYINDNGGINGKKIQYKLYDDGYVPSRCIKNTKKLVTKDKVFLLFNYVGTPTTKAIVPFTKKYKIPLFFPFTGAEFLRYAKKWDSVFNLRGSYFMETEKMVDYLLKNGKTKIAVFYQADSYGRAGLEGVRRATAKKGIKIHALGSYKRNTSDVKEVVNEITSKKPDAVIMIGAYKACAKFIKEVKKISNNDITFMNISFVGSKALAKELGKDGDGVLITEVVPFPWDTSNKAVEEYQEIMKKENKDFEPGFVSLEGFLSAKLLTEILRRSADNLTRENVVKETEALKDFDLWTGEKISFSHTDHQGFEKIYMVMIKDGKFVEVE